MERIDVSTNRRTALAVMAFVVLGIGIRWYNVAEARPVCPENPSASDDCFQLYGSLSDPLYTHLQARLIAQGHWFVNPFTALSEPADVPFEARARAADPSGPYVRSVGDPPAYQLLLGAASAVGLESGQSQRLLSSVLGAGTIVLAALLARRLAGDRAAIIAAAIAAVHPLLWINDGMLLSESIYAPIVLGGLLSAYRFRERPSPRRAAELGLVVMLAAMARGEAILLLPLLVLPMVLSVRELSWRARGQLLASAAAAAALLFVPWNIWINGQFREPVTMTAASGSVLSASSCDEHFYGKPLALFIYCKVDVDLPPGIDESQRDALVRDASTRYIRDHLRRLPLVMAVRVGRMWDVYGPQENLDLNIGVEDRGRLPSEWGLRTYYALLLPAAAGLVALRRRKVPIWPFASIALMVSITAATTFALTRYRVPADAALVVLAAVGIDAVARWVSRRRAAPADA